MLRCKCLIIICLIIPGVQGCDFVYRLLDKEGAQEKELVGEVTPYEKNPTVEEVQTLLKIYGYNPGKIDGMLGLRTRNTIERFQKDHNLKPSRFVDEETWAKLSVFKRNGLVEDGQLNVLVIQQILQFAGFKPGNIDGKFGPKTKKAVLDFQKAHQLKVDGKVGYKTLQALSTYLEPRSAD